MLCGQTLWAACEPIWPLQRSKQKNNIRQSSTTSNSDMGHWRGGFCRQALHSFAMFCATGVSEICMWYICLKLLKSCEHTADLQNSCQQPPQWELGRVPRQLFEPIWKNIIRLNNTDSSADRGLAIKGLILFVGEASGWQRIPAGMFLR